MRDDFICECGSTCDVDGEYPKYFAYCDECKDYAKGFDNEEYCADYMSAKIDEADLMRDR